MATVTINTGYWLGQGALSAPFTLTPQWSAVLVDGPIFYPGTGQSIQPNSSGVVVLVLEQGYYTIMFVGGQTVTILVPSGTGSYIATTLVTSPVAQVPGSLNNQYINGPNGTLWWQVVLYATPNNPLTAYAQLMGPLT